MSSASNHDALLTIHDDQPVADSPPEKKSDFRILLPLQRLEAAAESDFQFAIDLAHAYSGTLTALRVRTPEMPRTPRWVFEPESYDLPDDISFEIVEVDADRVAHGILQVARERKVNLIVFHLSNPTYALRTRLSRLLDPVIDQAPCDVAVIRGDVTEAVSKHGKARYMVATAGGGNATRALKLATQLARLNQGEVSLVTVIKKEASEAAEQEAEALLVTTMKEAGVREEEREMLVKPRVVRSDDVEGALLSAGRNHTLALVGAPEMSILNQLLTETIVEQLVNDSDTPILVLRRFNRQEFWSRRIWQAVDQLIPNITRDERLDAYKRTRRGARANHDFYILMLLSTIIATMGLLLNSAAVIIGAMLVAPLMTPMLAIALSVVMGDSKLLKVAIRSTFSGLILAIVVAAILTLLVPLTSYTDEILGRTQPNVLDLIVGLAAGAAGAYSVSRKSVAAALPGVAIAAALVPPLAVVGISLAMGRWGEAAGSLLLFGTNLVAISFSGAFVYMLLGFFPQSTDRHGQNQLRRGMIVILAFLFLITIPLISRSRTQTFTRTFNRHVSQIVQDEEGYSLLNMDWSKSPTLRMVVLASQPLTPAQRTALKEKVDAAAGQSVNLRLQVIPLQNLEATPVSE